MTLAELATLVSTKVHRTDDQSIAEAKTYIQMRYRMIWDSRPWRDSLNMLTVASTDVTRILILPAIVDRVINIRWGDSSTLLGMDLGSVLNVDPGLFERTGTPASFSVISPSAVAVSPAGSKIKIVSTDSAATFSITVRGLSGTTEVSENITASGLTEVTGTQNYDEIFALSKNSTSSDCTVKTTAGTTILTLETTETQKQFQRVHFQTNISQAAALLVLFKRRFRPLVADSDCTELTGIDNALVAAAVADILEAQRQYGKAQLKMQESQALAQQMADLERHQSSSGISLVPWDAAMAPDDVGYSIMPSIP